MSPVLARLEQIEERVAKATPGPWTFRSVTDARGDPCGILVVAEVGSSLPGEAAEYEEVFWGFSDAERGANWDLAAHSRADVPALANLVRALLAERCCTGSPETHLEARAAAARAIAEFGNAEEVR